MFSVLLQYFQLECHRLQDQSLRQQLQVGDHHKYGKFRDAMVRGRYEAHSLLHQRRHQVHLIR